ncbi:sgg [Symbiodinium sp. CCMP2592]|nr:sgg [Symbiodinium sp. CCMP2592]
MCTGSAPAPISSKAGKRKAFQPCDDIDPSLKLVRSASANLAKQTGRPRAVARAALDALGEDRDQACRLLLSGLALAVLDSEPCEVELLAQGIPVWLKEEGDESRSTVLSVGAFEGCFLLRVQKGRQEPLRLFALEPVDVCLVSAPGLIVEEAWAELEYTEAPAVEGLEKDENEEQPKQAQEKRPKQAQQDVVFVFENLKQNDLLRQRRYKKAAEQWTRTAPTHVQSVPSRPRNLKAWLTLRVGVGQFMLGESVGGMVQDSRISRIKECWVQEEGNAGRTSPQLFQLNETLRRRAFAPMFFDYEELERRLATEESHQYFDWELLETQLMQEADEQLDDLSCIGPSALAHSLAEMEDRLDKERDDDLFNLQTFGEDCSWSFEEASLLEVEGLSGSGGANGGKAEGGDLEFVAIKEVAYQNHKTREINLLKSITHSCVVSLLDSDLASSQQFCFVEPGEGDAKVLCMVLEYLPQNLHQKIGVEDVRCFSFQLLRALAHLDGTRIVHRDLKPENILLDPGSRAVRVADFGSAKDWWSCGCITAEMMLGRPLFTGESSWGQMYAALPGLNLVNELEYMGYPLRIFDDYMLLFDADYMDGSHLRAGGDCRLAGHFAKLAELERPASAWEELLPAFAEERQALELPESLLSFDPAKRLHPAVAMRSSFFQHLADDPNPLPPNLVDYSEEELSTCDTMAKKKLWALRHMVQARSPFIDTESVGKRAGYEEEESRDAKRRRVGDRPVDDLSDIP